MWTPQVLDRSEAGFCDLGGLIRGAIPAIVVRGLYAPSQCKEIVLRIKDRHESELQETGLRHIGPFVMSYATRKKEYFENAKCSQKAFEEIFAGIETPQSKISCVAGSMSRSLSLAKESENDYSPYVIRIHGKGHSIPLHKDSIKYEGREYAISGIDCQLSCIFHLQESELGGDLVVYNSQWQRGDEKFRDVDFGYAPDVVSASESCRISSARPGDLVVINPTFYHRVTTIRGDTPRITLGMFLGLYQNCSQMVAWA